jgi:hypothetical protein
MKQNPQEEKNKLEDLYEEYFVAEDTDENDDSLLQPSPLKQVDSFTTSGTIIDQG